LEEQIEDRQLLETVYSVGLTGNEIAVLSLSLDGLTVREIGDRLGVSHVQAVKHRKNIRNKCVAVLGREEPGLWR
jgi:DNA-binding CsgD family transcriptional regulator